MARKPSSTGLPEIWVPIDVVTKLNQLLPAHLMCYLVAIDMAGNTTGVIPRWVHARVAKRAGCSERVASAAYHRMVKLELVVPDPGAAGKWKNPRVTVRIGGARTSRRLPVAALWSGAKEDGPRWGAASGDAARALLALLNIMPNEAPTTTFPHPKVAKPAGLSSTAYRHGLTLLTGDTSWIDVQKRYLSAGERYGPVTGKRRDSNRVTLRWDVLAGEVADRATLMTLGNAQKAQMEAVKSANLSTKHAEFPASAHGDFPASADGENPASAHADFPASITTFSCQRVLSLTSSSMTSSSIVTALPPPASDHPTKGEEEASSHDENQEPKLTLVPAPSLTVSDVLNAKNRQEAAKLIRAAVNRAGDWRSLDDESWVAATIAAIHYAPGDHALPITDADARQLAPALLVQKARAYTPLALAQLLVGPHLNRGVRSTVNVLHHRLTKISPEEFHGAGQDSNDLLSHHTMIPAKHAREARGEAPPDEPKRIYHDRWDDPSYVPSFY